MFFTVSSSSSQAVKSSIRVSTASSINTEQQRQQRDLQEHEQHDIVDPIQELIESMNINRLQKIAQQYKKQYQNAKPYPHLVLDDLFPKSILQKVIEEHPESMVQNDGCLQGKEWCSQNQVKGQKHKSSIATEEEMGYYTRILFLFLKSSTFIQFLQQLTGIQNVIADPHYYGSGLHVIGPNGSLDLHHDFNTLVDHKMERRINMFIFLNPNWVDEYGGHLEMWSHDRTKCYERILPILGRFAVFSTSDFSWHGHPHPLSCPPGRARRSIALYFYTTGGRPKEECYNSKCAWMANFKDYLYGTTFVKPELGCTTCLDKPCNFLPKEDVPSVH